MLAMCMMMKLTLRISLHSYIMYWRKLTLNLQKVALKCLVYRSVLSSLIEKLCYPQNLLILSLSQD